MRQLILQKNSVRLAITSLKSKQALGKISNKKNKMCEKLTVVYTAVELHNIEKYDKLPMLVVESLYCATDASCGGGSGVS